MAKSKLPRRKKIKVKAPIIWTVKDRGWTAQIIKSEAGPGWAVTMTRDGDDEPAYMGPWTMGRNKVDPKPMSQNAFNTWVKSATEFLARSQYQIKTVNRQVFTIYTESGEELGVSFDIDLGDYESEGRLVAEDTYGNEVAQTSVSPKFDFNLDSATAWVMSDFAPPPPPPEEKVHIAVDVDDVWDPDADEPDEGEEDFTDTVFVADEQIQQYEEPVFEYD